MSDDIQRCPTCNRPPSERCRTSADPNWYGGWKKETCRHEIHDMADRAPEMLAAATHLDEMLLRFAFDAGAIGDEHVSGLGIDPWGVLADFRAAFGLEPTMTPEEWTGRAMARGEERSDG